MSETPDQQSTFDVVFQDDSDGSLPGANAAQAGDQKPENPDRSHPTNTTASPPTDLPAPDSPAVQAAAVVGRTQFQPILRRAGSVESYTVTTEQTHSAVEDVIEILEAVSSHGHSIGRVFTDWIRLQLLSLAANDTEAKYRSTIERYQVDPQSESHRTRPALLLPEAFATLVEGVIETGRDLYGDIYHQLSQNSERLGQYFTPHTVAQAKTELLSHGETAGSEFGAGDRSATAIEERTSVLDPACGSGRLLVAAARAHPDGIYSGVDKDPTCARMAALNLLLCNVDGQIVHGDSLTMDAQTVYTVRHTKQGGILKIDDPDDVSHPLSTPSE